MFFHWSKRNTAEIRALHTGLIHWYFGISRFVDVNVDVRVECVTQAQRFLVTQPASVPDISGKASDVNFYPQVQKVHSPNLLSLSLPS